MKQFDAEILETRELARDCFELSFTWPEGLRAPLPGQFVTVGSSSPVPFLRHLVPVARFHRESRTAAFLFDPGTPAGSRLSRRRPGEFLDILGPRGFAFQTKNQGRPLLVGSGTGVGALVFAANWLVSKGHRPRLVLGFSDQTGVPSLSLPPEVEYTVCTADGSQGFKGTEVTFLNTVPVEDSLFVWSAAPRKSLQAVHLWALSARVPCQVCLEQVTACAVGACQGCTVATSDDRQFARVCTEGPVFPSEVIQWT